MTPLLRTKTSSVPVGAKSGGDRRDSRSLLSCALWRGMGRLWRGMGGMGRPEPLSAQRPHQQQGLSGFHETRDPRHGYCQARRAGCPLGRREFRGFHESRDTNHGLDALFIIVHHCSPLFAIVQQKILSRPAPLATAPVSSRLLPLRPTQDQPMLRMLRKGNVRCCDDTLLSSLEQTREATLTPSVRFGILPLHGGLVQATGLLYRPGFGRQGRRYLHHVSNLPAVNRWG